MPEHTQVSGSVGGTGLHDERDAALAVTQEHFGVERRISIDYHKTTEMLITNCPWHIIKHRPKKAIWVGDKGLLEKVIQEPSFKENAKLGGKGTSRDRQKTPLVYNRH